MDTFHVTAPSARLKRRVRQSKITIDRPSWSLERSKTTRNLADYEGPFRRIHEDPPALSSSLFSSPFGLFSVKPNRRRKIFRRLVFVGGVRLQKGKKEIACFVRHGLCPGRTPCRASEDSPDRVSCRSTDARDAPCRLLFLFRPVCLSPRVLGQIGMVPFRWNCDESNFIGVDSKLGCSLIKWGFL